MDVQDIKWTLTKNGMNFFIESHDLCTAAFQPTNQQPAHSMLFLLLRPLLFSQTLPLTATTYILYFLTLCHFLVLIPFLSLPYHIQTLPMSVHSDSKGSLNGS